MHEQYHITYNTNTTLVGRSVGVQRHFQHR